MLLSQQLTHLVLLKAAWAHNPRGDCYADIPDAARALVRCSSLELSPKRSTLLALFNKTQCQVTYVSIRLMKPRTYDHAGIFLPSVADQLLISFLITHTVLYLLD